MRAVFDSSDAETVLQVDATNAFNYLNRQPVLTNISVLCPSFARILINTYREDSKLYIDGNYILSQEGATQGNHANVCPWYCASYPAIGQYSGLTDVVYR